MNFLDLYKKIKELEDNVEQRNLNEGLSQGNIMPQAISAPPSAPIQECGMGECGDMPMPSHEQHAPPQQDSVTMTVSMNGSGKGGIRDLMDVLRNIESKIDSKPEIEPHHSPIGGDEIVVGEPEVLDSIEPVTFEEPELPQMPSEEPVMDEEGDEGSDYANNPKIQKMSVAAIIGTGDDLASKGTEAPKQAGGGNPWNVNETKIATKLAQHYAEVKSRTNEGRPPLNPDKFSDANKIQGSWDKEAKSFKRREHDAEWEQEKRASQAQRDANEGPWYLRSDGGKVLKVGGQPKVFDRKNGASRYADKVGEKNPWFKNTLILTRKPEDVSPEEHMQSWEKVHYGHPYPNKQRLNTPLGAVEHKLRMSGNFRIFEPGQATALERNDKKADYSIYIAQMHNRHPEFVEDFYQYYDLLSKDPNTDDQTRQLAAADAAAFSRAIAHSSEH